MPSLRASHPPHWPLPLFCPPWPNSYFGPVLRNLEAEFRPRLRFLWRRDVRIGCKMKSGTYLNFTSPTTSSTEAVPIIARNSHVLNRKLFFQLHNSLIRCSPCWCFPSHCMVISIFNQPAAVFHLFFILFLHPQLPTSFGSLVIIDISYCPNQ